jgi:hypothetical protein
MEMMRLIMPKMMKDMKSIMAEIVDNLKESDCKEMIMGMPPETREKCRKMMTSCLKISEEM